MSKKWLILGSVSFSVGLSLSLIINKDIKRAALTGLLSVPAATAGVLVTEHQRKQKLNDRISTKQEQLQGLVKQENNLNSSITSLSDRISDLKQQKEDISVAVSNLDTDKQQSQSELDTLENQTTELNERKLELEGKIATLELKLKQLIDRETNLSTSQQQIETHLVSNRQSIQKLRSQKFDLEQNLSSLVIQKQNLTEQLDSQQLSLNRLQQDKADLENAIDNLRGEKQEYERTFLEQRNELSREINDLQQEKILGERSLTELNIEHNVKELSLTELQQNISKIEHELNDREAHKVSISLEIEQLREEEIQLSQFILELNDRKQNLQVDCNNYQIELQRLEQQQTDLTINIRQLNSLLATTPNEVESEREDLSAEEIIIPEVIDPVINIVAHELNLSNAEHTQYLWENIIIAAWNHQDRPAGYRFLGNVDIDSAQSDRITDLLKEKLQQSAGISVHLENNLLKIITFVLSEYAYYSNEERFWQGFCDRLSIEHTNTVENALKEITRKGINLLGLVRASGGYRYVSTLWLQSGVPKQNMGHFATILQDVADEYYLIIP